MIDDFPEDRAQRLIEKYPQFATAGPLVTDAIREALQQVDAGVFGAKANTAVELLACDWLMTHEYGASLRSDDDTSKPTRFRIQYDALFKQVVPRMIVI